MAHKHEHDWFDDYMMYSMMNAGRTDRSGGEEWGCVFALLFPFGLYLLFCLIVYVLTGGNI